jgi:hypothetical protein
MIFRLHLSASRAPHNSLVVLLLGKKMTRAYPAPTTPDEQKIKRLEDELERARWDIIDLMPEKRRKILMSFFHCESRDDTYRWEGKITEELIGEAEVIGSPFGDRAYCPLCGDGSSSGYERGYSIPVGLTRHLTGWGRTRECAVVRAASAIARDYWNKKFSPTEREQEAKNADLLAKRKASEMLFLADPSGQPKLFDERLHFGNESRDKEEMTWAEKRLSDLHFRVLTVDRVRSYVDERDEIFVYADPRAKGAIEFSAYMRRGSKSKSSRPKFSRIGSFRLPDRWKNDLGKKYEGWLAMLTATKP